VARQLTVHVEPFPVGNLPRTACSASVQSRHWRYGLPLNDKRHTLIDMIKSCRGPGGSEVSTW